MVLTRKYKKVLARARRPNAVAYAEGNGEWRRTSEGWQRTSGWPSMADRNAVPPAAKVHPLVLATLIGLISLGGLIGFGSPRRRSQ